MKQDQETQEIEERGKTARLYIALVHHPVLNRLGEIIASAVTNLDLHDLARAACTYDLPACYIVTPLRDQQTLTDRLVSHWREGIGREIHPDRAQALARLRVLESIEAAVDDIREECGRAPVVWATTAREAGEALSHAQARELLAEREGPFLLLLGTGWGLAPSVMHMADAVLAGIRGVNGYNHLSVRCAAAILMDRLLGADR